MNTRGDWTNVLKIRVALLLRIPRLRTLEYTNLKGRPIVARTTANPDGEYTRVHDLLELNTLAAATGLALPAADA